MNGVVSSDRTPHPALAEIKRVQQYIHVRPVDLLQGEAPQQRSVLEIENEYDFTNLQEIAVGRWKVRAGHELLGDKEPYVSNAAFTAIASFDDEESLRWLAHDGLWFQAIEQGEGMQRDYSYDSRRSLTDLEPAEETGAEAARRTVRRLDSRRLPTGKMPVLCRRHSISETI